MTTKETELKNKLVNSISSILKVYAIGYAVKENSKVRKAKLKEKIKSLSNA